MSTAYEPSSPSLTLGRIRIERIPELIATGIVLAAAGVSPLMFVAAAAGYGSMDFYARYALLPAVFVVLLIALVARLRPWQRLHRGIVAATIAGPLATVALEAARVVGFRVFHAMPGSMPMLMGVLITDRFLLGPNVWSDIAGWADHILANGIGFALVYVLVLGRARWWAGILYAWAVGTIFMISPDMKMLGDIGNFGLAMGPGFAITVYVAHTLFGATLGVIVERGGTSMQPIWRRYLNVTKR